MYSSLEERSLVYFPDNAPSLLRAYVDSGEGLDRAGGFAVQVRDHTSSAAFWVFYNVTPNRAWVGCL
jgi:hypothetical protein